jgi:hypothetical protein
MQHALNFLQTLHGHNRWLLVAAWAFCLGLLLLLRWRPQLGLRGARLSFTVFLILYALQALLGIVLFIGTWAEGIPLYRWEHSLLMLLNLALLHLPIRWRRLEAPQWSRRMLWLLLLVGVLGFLGVSRLPKGWLG